MINSNFIKPRYNDRCFADLPATILHLLTGTGQSALNPALLNGLSQQYDTIILFFVDGFGWRFYEKCDDFYPFLRRIATEGQVSQLTSQFPSTTAAHVTTIHTGLPVGQSGVYEWFFYEPQLDEIIAPLLFSFAGDSQRDSLKQAHVDPQRLFSWETLYQRLHQHGVASYVFQHGAYAHSTYSELLCEGVTRIVPYKSLSEALVNMQFLLERQTSPAYFFLYFSQIDSQCHDYGPNLPHVEAEIDTFFTTMERLFYQKLAGKLTNTLVMLTADHGLVEVDPETTIYLNTDSAFKGIEQFIKTNRQGQFIVPVGSPRDMFLYIKEDRLMEAQAFLASRLLDRAEVRLVADLIAEGYFGPPPMSAEFLGRVGNLVILPYAGESVWWYEEDHFEMNFYGHHGGLTEQEMAIPLLMWEFM